VRLVTSVVQYADRQNDQSLGQRLAWKVYVNLIFAVAYMEGRAGFVPQFLSWLGV
jgi:hypothetical protein